jgi:hypothetical protein
LAFLRLALLPRQAAEHPSVEPMFRRSENLAFIVVTLLPQYIRQKNQSRTKRAPKDPK